MSWEFTTRHTNVSRNRLSLPVMDKGLGVGVDHTDPWVQQHFQVVPSLSSLSGVEGDGAACASDRRFTHLIDVQKEPLEPQVSKKGAKSLPFHSGCLEAPLGVHEMGQSSPKEPVAAPFDSPTRVLPALPGGIWKSLRVLEGTGSMALGCCHGEQPTPSSRCTGRSSLAILGKYMAACARCPGVSLPSILALREGWDAATRSPRRGVLPASSEATLHVLHPLHHSWVFLAEARLCTWGLHYLSSDFQATPESSGGNPCPSPRHCPGPEGSSLQCEEGPGIPLEFCFFAWSLFTLDCGLSRGSCGGPSPWSWGACLYLFPHLPSSLPSFPAGQHWCPLLN